MYENVKLCPECEAEFYPQIEECNGCNVKLVTPEELEFIKCRQGSQAQENTSFAPGTEPGIDMGVPGAESADMSIVDKGSHARIAELAGVLSARGLTCSIAREVEEPGAKSCSKSNTYVLLVNPHDFEAAGELIDEHWHSQHPEIKEAAEKLDSGICPACGFDAAGARECPDCGLNLAATIEDDIDHDHDDGSGGCGPGSSPLC